MVQLQEKLLASGCAGGSVNLWDTSTGEVLVHLEQAHAGPIHAIAFKDSNFFTGGRYCMCCLVLLVLLVYSTFNAKDMSCVAVIIKLKSGAWHPVRA